MLSGIITVMICFFLLRSADSTTRIKVVSRQPFPKDPLVFLSTNFDLRVSPDFNNRLEGEPPELLRAALKDGGVAGALEKSSRYLEEHPDGMAIVLSSFKAETDPKLISLLGKLIGDYADADTCKVITKVAQEDPLAEKREVALEILRRSREVTPALMESVRHILREDANLHVRLAAETTLNQWQHEDRLKLQTKR
ncbi:MAG: hypothetical protein M3Y82_02050 [Verrucomicrobiota bacterium]|nr:hypothetical protein [Verrucomicrobiota bacterium]